MQMNLLALVVCLFLTGICLCQAPVPVSQEPRHHKILENDHVRLLDVHIPPGDTSMIHIHATPSVFVILNNVKTGSEVISEEDHSGSPIPHFGNIWFEGFYEKPRIHRVWNSGQSEFHVMDIEMVNKNFISPDAPFTQKFFTFLFDEKPVRAYRLDLVPAVDITLAARKADILMVLLTDSVISVRLNKKDFHKKGEFLYISSGIPLKIHNGGPATVEFAFFELK